MDTIVKKNINIEINALDLSYSHIRLTKKNDIKKIISSIDKYGQLTPVVVVLENDKFVLVDGYIRCNALQRLAKDIIKAEIWDCNISQALLLMLAEKQSRTWEAIEESLLIRELQTTYNLSQEKIANNIGKDQSWVSRRISLIEYLSEALISVIIAGNISLWTAVRVLSPMARAIPSHAQLLTEYLKKNKKTTREMKDFYEHYKCSSKQTRINIINDPDLFFKAQNYTKVATEAKQLKEGPEGDWIKWFNIINSLIKKLITVCPNVIYSKQLKDEQDKLLHHFHITQEQFDLLSNVIGDNYNVKQRS
ncbi:MAG: ParB N-terminal domain-containing protein [Melioribacteraceae bacterium]|nr:ParB N-terminal domain-containing protein [Melioribacteraceae bacterium]